MLKMSLFAAAALVTLVSASPPDQYGPGPGADSDDYPPCSRTVRDHCTQIRESGPRTSLGDESRVMPGLYTISLDDNQVEFGYGRGLWCALAGVGLAMLALYLSGRSATWTWRRRPAQDEPVIPDQPLELTVGPATPFSTLTDDRSLLPGDRDEASRS